MEGTPPINYKEICKMQKKRIMISALALVVVALVASWGVNAYFNDVEQSNGNSVTAGTLDLQLNSASDVVTPVYTVTNVYPGFTTNGTGTTITLTNAGSINGVLNMTATITSTGPGTETEPELKDAGNDATLGDLQEVFMVKIMEGSNQVYAGLLSGFNTNTWTYNLDDGASVTLTMYVWVPAAADNEIQGDTLSFTLGFTLNQHVGTEI